MNVPTSGTETKAVYKRFRTRPHQKNSLVLYSSSRKPPRAAKLRRPARKSELAQTPKSHKNSFLSRAVVILYPVIAADNISFIHSPEPLNTVSCQFTPLIARRTKLGFSGIGGSGTRKPAKMRRSRTNAVQHFNRYTSRRLYGVKWSFPIQSLSYPLSIGRLLFAGPLLSSALLFSSSEDGSY